MEKILCFLNGYVEVLICGGQTERFFNLCMARGIVVRNLRQNKDKSFTCIFSVNHFFLLGPIRRKTKVRIHILEKQGLPSVSYTHLDVYKRQLLDMGKGTGAEGFDAFKASVEGAAVSEEAKEIAELYANAKKAMIVFQQNVVTTEAAALLGDIAVVSGHIGKARDGILMLKAKNNSQGLVAVSYTHLDVYKRQI